MSLPLLKLILESNQEERTKFHSCNNTAWVEEKTRKSCYVYSIGMVWNIKNSAESFTFLSLLWKYFEIVQLQYKEEWEKTHCNSQHKA
jgi:hypothetical protein